jgi:hypothetical protein
MSANNFIEIIQIKKDFFEVWDKDIETGQGYVVAKADTLEEAIERAQIHMLEETVEYGIHFKLLPKKKREK